jgi:hypothetical protein
MPNWRNEVRKCDHCRSAYRPKRKQQVFCRERCRDAAKKRRKRSGDRMLPPTRTTRSGDMGLSIAPMPLGDGSTVVWPDFVASLERGARFPSAGATISIGWERASIERQPRSMYLLRGAARTDWQHSIPPVDKLRYSITFRSLRESISR